MLVLGFFLVVGHPFGSFTTYLYARQFEIASVETLDAQLLEPSLMLIHATAVTGETGGMSINDAKQILTGSKSEASGKVVADAVEWEMSLTEAGAAERVEALIAAGKGPKSKATPVVVFSELKGVRAYMALAALRAAGYSNVINGGHTDHVNLRYRAMLANKKRAAAGDKKQGQTRKDRDPEL